jgi:hypothetical protein
MVPMGGNTVSGTPDGRFAGEALLGKRYVSEDLGVEVLCTKAGLGTLSIGDQALEVKAPNALPASD